jgi:hypothetical protein
MDRKRLLAVCLAVLPCASLALSAEGLEATTSVTREDGVFLREALAAGARLVQPEELARVETSKGNFVSWSYLAEEERVAVLVGASYPNKPLVSRAFAERHDALDVFLALAALDAPVPAKLASLGAERGALLDARTRYRLQQENRRQLDEQPVFEAQPLVKQNAGPALVGCSQSFEDWVGSVYGDATCGTLVNDADWTYASHTYCTSGCTYKLGSVDKGSCSPALKSCNIVRGKMHNLRQRMSEWNGNGWMGYSGRWVHYGAANCSGNGDIQWYVQRGDTVYGPYAIAVGGMLHFADGLGTWNMPASAATNVTWGEWDRGLPPSGPYYKANKSWLDNNAGGNDRAILCGDTRNKYTMTDESSPTCQSSEGTINLCLGGNCTNDCWHCVGGSCN